MKLSARFSILVAALCFFTLSAPAEDLVRASNVLTIKAPNILDKS